MLHRLFIALSFLSALFMSSSAMSVLSGQRVPASTASPFVGYSQLVDREIHDCSGVFVSENTILTAAHCFDALVDRCARLKGCQPRKGNVFDLRQSSQVELSLDRQTAISSYRLIRHPLYRVNDYSSVKQSQSNNYDLALVVIPKNRARRSFLPVAQKAPQSGEKLWSYGTGMSQLTLFSEPHSDVVYNQEAGLGTLKRALLSIQRMGRGELLQSRATLVGQPSQKGGVKLSPIRGGQILGSDSGGPLVKQGKVYAVTRNYELSFISEDLGRVQQGLQSSFQMTGKSVFTSLQTPRNKRFLLSAQNYGGRVHFQ